jgi:hypothetical protein
VYPQVPLVQVLVAFARAGHARPHTPQLLTFVCVLISHPSAALLLQSL